MKAEALRERETGKAFSHVVKCIPVDLYRPEVRYVAKIVLSDISRLAIT